MVYNQELGFYAFRQGNLSNPQWYERFNKKVNVGESIGMTRQNKVLLEYMVQELYTQIFSAVTKAEKIVTREDSEKRYLYYAFLRKGGSQHVNLKVDLQNDFTTGNNRYPKNPQQTLHLLDNYRNTAVKRMTQSKGTAFVQGSRGHRGGRGRDNRGRRGNKNFDK